MSQETTTLLKQQKQPPTTATTLVLASASAIKLKAMASVFDPAHCTSRFTATIQSVDVWRCMSFEQPFDYHGAHMCAMKRIAEAVRLGREAGTHRVDTQYVAIENYVTETQPNKRALQDRALVVHWSELTGGVPFLSRDNAVQIPDAFVDWDTDYSSLARSQGGTHQTFGRTIANCAPNMGYGDGIRHDDWFHHFTQAGSPFPQMSRHHQLLEVLVEMRDHLQCLQRLVRSVRVCAGYAGVPQFLDLWSVFASPAQTANMLQQMQMHCMDAIRATDADGNELQPPIIVGLEMRGAVLGAMLAHRLSLPFVPIRKLGAKLPGKCIQSGGGSSSSNDGGSGENAKTEYGSSTAVQMQVEYVGGGLCKSMRQRCIVVDDVIATGNSLAVACEMLETSGGFEVAAIVAFMDIPALRETWRKRLGCDGVQQKRTVHVCVDVASDDAADNGCTVE